MPAACWAFCFHRNSQLGCNLTKAPPHCLIISEIMIWRRGCSCSSPPPPDRIYWRTASSSPALAPNNRGPRFLIVRPLATAGLPHPCGLTLGVPSNQDSNIVSSRGESGVPRAMFALHLGSSHFTCHTCMIRTVGCPTTPRFELIQRSGDGGTDGARGESIPPLLCYSAQSMLCLYLTA